MKHLVLLLCMGLFLSGAVPLPASGTEAAWAAQASDKPAKAKAEKKADRAKKGDRAKKANRAAASVYDRQPPVTEKELLGFLDILPQFRAWAKAGNEEAHPVLRNGKPDFLYSDRAAAWVKDRHWEPVRFFCVMGRMAAALSIVEEGNDMSNARAGDMPEVSEGELALARKHLGSMLRAGGDVPPINK